MTVDLFTSARHTAAGALALIADGDQDAARSALRMFLQEGFETHGLMASYQALLSGVMGVAIAATNSPERFREIAAQLAVNDGEWV